MSDPTSRPASASHPTRQQLDELDALMERMLALPVNQNDEETRPATAALPGLGAIAVEPPPTTIAPPPELSEPKAVEPQPAPTRIPEPRIEAPAVEYRRAELPQPTPLFNSPEPRTPEPRVEHPANGYRTEPPAADYPRPVETPAVDYRRVEVVPVVPPRIEMPPPEYRIPDVNPVRIPDVTPLPPPAMPQPLPPVAPPAAVNGKEAHLESPAKLNGNGSRLEPIRLKPRLSDPPPLRSAPLLRRKPTRAFRRPISGLMLAPFIWTNLTFDRWVGRCGRLGRSFRTPGGRMLLGWLGLAFLSAAIAWAVINGMGWTR
jgi:hypothetical protein